MDKLLGIIGLGKIVYTYDDLGPDIQAYNRKNMLIDAVLLIGAVIFGVTSKNLAWFLGSLGIVAVAVLYHQYMLMLFLCGKVFFFDGKLKDITSPLSPLTYVTKKEVHTKQLQLEIETPEGTFIVPVPSSKGYRAGNIIRVYVMKDGIYMKDADTYDVPSPILVTKIKN